VPLNMRGPAGRFHINEDRPVATRSNQVHQKGTIMTTAPHIVDCSPSSTKIVTDTVLAVHAAEIRRLGKRVVDDVAEIGRRLVECKGIVGHGNWLPWLEREFGWTDQTARNFMHAHELGQTESKTILNLNLPLRGLYLLAAPSTPVAARMEIAKRAEAAEPISFRVVRETVTRHKEKSARPRSASETMFSATSAAPIRVKSTPECGDDIDSVASAEAAVADVAATTTEVPGEPAAHAAGAAIVEAITCILDPTSWPRLSEREAKRREKLITEIRDPLFKLRRLAMGAAS
jgi:hypothetical protein